MTDWLAQLVHRVATTADGQWCSHSGAVAAELLRHFAGNPDAQADLVGLLIDEIERLNQREGEDAT
jgi:hypothetical protein